MNTWTAEYAKYAAAMADLGYPPTEAQMAAVEGALMALVIAHDELLTKAQRALRASREAQS